VIPVLVRAASAFVGAGDPAGAERARLEVAHGPMSGAQAPRAVFKLRFGGEVRIAIEKGPPPDLGPSP
jgi:hypothetical protein